MSSEPCPDCRDPQTLVKSIAESSKATAQAHLGIAALYRLLARSFPNDQQELQQAAVEQETMAAQCREIVLPDGVELPTEKDAP